MTSSVSTVATAIAAIPSPRPIAPSPSFVVALMLIACRFESERGRDFLLHRRNVRRNLRRFRDQRRVDIHRARIFLRER